MVELLDSRTMSFWTRLIVLFLLSLMTCGSALSQTTLCSQRGDKNGFQISDVDILCELSLNNWNTGANTGALSGKPKLLDKLFAGFDMQRLGGDTGADSNSWVLRFRDGVGKVRSLIVSNVEKSRKLFTYPRKMFGNFEEVIGDTQWDPTIVRHGVGGLLTTNRKQDFDVRPPATTISFTDIWRSMWRPKETAMIEDMKTNAAYLTSNTRRKSSTDGLINRELFGKSLPFIGSTDNDMIYDKQYFEIISKINEMSNAMRKAEAIGKQSETVAKSLPKSSFPLKTDDPSVKSSFAAKQTLNKNADKKVNQKLFDKKLTKKSHKVDKNRTKLSTTEWKSGPKVVNLSALIPSETDRHLMAQSFSSHTVSSPPLKRVPLSVSTGMSAGTSKIYSSHKQQLSVPRIAPPTPIINPTSVLSRPMDFAQTILPEPTSDIDTFTYRDALIGDDTSTPQVLQQMSPKDSNELSFFTLN